MRDGDDVLAAFDEQCDSADRSRELCDIFGLGIADEDDDAPRYYSSDDQ